MRPGIYSEEDDVENMVFKNERIKQKYLKAQQEEREQNRKSDINMTIPNLISSVNGKHPSLNYTNIYKLTIYQLLDTFSRLQNNTIFDLDSTRVSVWGDEKKTFKSRRMGIHVLSVLPNEDRYRGFPWNGMSDKTDRWGK